MKIVYLAWKNIVDKPLNLLLSILLFALGIGLINFLLLLQAQLKEKFEANLAGIDLVIGAKGSPLQMILCSMYHIDNPTGNLNINEAKAFLNPKHPLIKKAVPLSLGDNYKSYRIVGTNYGILDLYKASIKEGRLWRDDQEVTLGWQVAKEAGLNMGDKFMSSHGLIEDDNLMHDHSSLKVCGILAPTGSVIDQLILTNTATIWNVHDHEADNEIERDTIEASDPLPNANHVGDEHHDHHDDTTQIAEEEHTHDNSNSDLISHGDKQITSILIQYKNKSNFQALNMPRAINENTNMQAASPPFEINKLYSMIGVGTDAIQWIGILIGLVSMLSIFISLYKSMKERKYELALMRVMGGPRSSLFLLVIIEGLILALIGWIIGIALSHGGLEIMARYLKADFRYSFSGLRWLTSEWWLLGISLLLGTIAALIPAIQASNTDINKTLSS